MCRVDKLIARLKELPPETIVRVLSLDNSKYDTTYEWVPLELAEPLSLDDFKFSSFLDTDTFEFTDFTKDPLLKDGKPMEHQKFLELGYM